MPPRKGSSSQSYDASKFVSLATQERYTSQHQLKPIQERGLIQHLNHHVKKKIKDYKWEVLCDHPEPAVVPVVREFYANGMERQGLTVTVRGKTVSFARSTINRYYGLNNFEDDEYQQLVTSDNTNWDEIKDFLCKDEVTWSRYTNGGLKSFPGQAMTKVAKIWHYFICAKLLPTTNHSAVMKSRAALIYAILNDMKIDVGLIIQHSIIHGFEKGIQGFPHPHLVTDLCANAGVRWNAKEEVRKPKGVIDDSVVVKIQGDDAPVGASSSSQVKLGTTQARLEHMEHYMQSQFTYLNQYQHSMVQYMQSSNLMWTQMFTDCAQALHVDTSSWPAVPLFQPPPPPQPVPAPPPPPPTDFAADIRAQQEEEAALAADDPMGDL